MLVRSQWTRFCKACAVYNTRFCNSFSQSLESRVGPESRTGHGNGDIRVAVYGWKPPYSKGMGLQFTRVSAAEHGNQIKVELIQEEERLVCDSPDGSWICKMSLLIFTEEEQTIRRHHDYGHIMIQVP